MSEETKRLWDLVKHKLSKRGLLDVILYYPELKEEVDNMIDLMDHLEEHEFEVVSHDDP